MTNKPASTFVSLALAILMMAGAPRQALANSFETLSRASSNLLSLSQQITQDTLLIALGVDSSENMAKLSAGVQALGDQINILRSGDQETDVSGQWPAALDAQLSHIQKLSGDLVGVIAESQKARAITPKQVQAVAQIEASLHAAVEAFQRDYRTHSSSREVYSLYLQTLDVARQQALLSQKMFTEFLFVAYQFQAAQNQRKLNRSYSLLDRSFQALIYGDSELQLIPAPNQMVERYWNDARSIWIGFRPIIKQVARTGAVDAEQITEVAARNQELLTAMTNAVEAY